MTANDPVLSALGLCRRAGALVMGTPLLCRALRDGKPTVVLALEAADTSDATHKRVTDKCAFYGVKSLRLDTSCEELAAALGKTGAVAAVGVTDPSLAKLVEEKINRTRV